MIMQAAEPRVLRWTREEYYRIAELGFFRGRRVELIEGDIIEMSPQDAPHAAAIRLIDYTMKRVFQEGFLVCVQLPLSLGSDSEPEPDLAVVKGTLRDYHRSHPDTAVLVIEVAGSSLEYDRTRKASVYAEAGIQDYWIVDLVSRKVEVLRKPLRHSKGPIAFGYGEHTPYAPGQSITPLALPGVAVPVAEILI